MTLFWKILRKITHASRRRLLQTGSRTPTSASRMSVFPQKCSLLIFLSLIRTTQHATVVNRFENSGNWVRLFIWLFFSNQWRFLSSLTCCIKIAAVLTFSHKHVILFLGTKKSVNWKYNLMSFESAESDNVTSKKLKNLHFWAKKQHSWRRSRRPWARLEQPSSTGMCDFSQLFSKKCHRCATYTMRFEGPPQNRFAGDS